MDNKESNITLASGALAVRAIIVWLLLLLFFAVTTRSEAQTTQSGFATPQEAAAALIKAAGENDISSLRVILGPDGDKLLSTADPVEDRNHLAAFTAAATEKNSVTINPKNHGQATIIVGKLDWPLPIPLAKRGPKWYFDTKVGRDEILYRRIGANELDAIQMCYAYAEAQEEYGLEIHDDSGVNQYAQRIISSPGKHDGLAWRNADGSTGGPLGEELAKAIAEGYGNKSHPYHGYYFKVLKGQGPAAPLGQLDYTIKGAMIGGFALIAWPAQYRVTGVQTFIISYNNVVYQKDQGLDTAKTPAVIDRYNPDKSWRPTDDRW